jgi:hypothetical protein
MSDYILSDDGKWFVPVNKDITNSYQYKLSKDPWVSPLLDLKKKYKLSHSQLMQLNEKLARVRAEDSVAGDEKKKDHYIQIMVKYIKTELLNA